LATRESHISFANLQSKKAKTPMAGQSGTTLASSTEKKMAAHNKDKWKLAFHHGEEKTSFLNNSRRQLCENLPASVSVALKYAIRASRAFSCVGALESATAFLNRGPTTQQEEN
jgi:hypothetical protein